MLVLDFELDEYELAEFRKAAGHTDPAALQETFLVMPVRLRVGDTELLRTPDAPPEGPAFLRLPLLHVATIGADCIRSLRQRNAARYSLPGAGVSLLFDRSGSEVCIRSELTGGTGHASMDELVGAVETFVERVKATVGEVLPPSESISQWQTWLGGS
jgi:hypothetical protein